MTEKGLPEINVNWCEWYDADKITAPTYTLKRLDDNKGNRFYYEPLPFDTRAGITSLMQRVLPPSYAIQEWQKKHGDKAGYMLDISSRYGTAGHILNKDWVVSRKMNEDEMNKCEKYCKEYGASEDMPHKDFVCFMKFCEDYKIKPLLCEAMLRCMFNNEYYALTLDLLCEMTFIEKETKVIQEEKTKKEFDLMEDGHYKSGKKKGMVRLKKVPRIVKYSVPKEVTVKKESTRLCLVDFKTNFFEKTEKDFYESHLFQLLAAKEAVKQNFDLDVDVLINYAPNSWRTEPGYSAKKWQLKETDSPLFNNVLEQARLRGYFKPQGQIFVPLPVTSESKHTDVYSYLTYEQYAIMLETRNAQIPVLEIPPSGEIILIENTNNIK